MAITSTHAGTSGTLLLSDRLTYSDSSQYRQELFALFNAGVTTIEINLVHLTFMDSAGIGMLLVSLNECKQRGISLVLCQPKGDIKALLELTNSYERFIIKE